MRIILASTSVHRKTLLSRLNVPFDVQSPSVDESILEAESPQDLACRLAHAKANAVARALSTNLDTRAQNLVVIGSDQVACCDDLILNKPGIRDNAIAQLMACSGKTVDFYTALCVMGVDDSVEYSKPPVFQSMDHTKVHFRTLTRAEIEAYVDAEDVLSCAGSFKCEGLGITLFEAIETRDPTALIGLPLISVCAALRHFENNHGMTL